MFLTVEQQAVMLRDLLIEHGIEVGWPPDANELLQHLVDEGWHVDEMVIEAGHGATRAWWPHLKARELNTGRESEAVAPLYWLAALYLVHSVHCEGRITPHD